MGIVTIMRGISGSGKSGYLSKCWNPSSVGDENKIIVSTDSWFYGPDGYKFDRTQLRQAHNECMRRFVNACYNKIANIAVDNTNLSIAEIAPYYAVASAYDYKVNIITCEVDPQVAATRNLHGVPVDTCIAMHDALKTNILPPFWIYDSFYYSPEKGLALSEKQS